MYEFFGPSDRKCQILKLFFMFKQTNEKGCQNSHRFPRSPKGNHPCRPWEPTENTSAPQTHTPVAKARHKVDTHRLPSLNKLVDALNTTLTSHQPQHTKPSAPAYPFPQY